MTLSGLNKKGGRRRRVETLVAGAQQQLEEHEVVREVVQVQAGESPWRTAGGIAYLAGPGVGSLPNVRGSFALMATERHVYAMLLKGARLTRVEEASLKQPLSETRVRLEGEEIVLQGQTFYVMKLFGRRAKSFVAYVRERSEAHQGAG
jgi:hypothetical protein